jgi:hypothetical protein
MATTYTVTNSFSADTTAVASEVNQNFTDVLTALNSFDATNLTGTIALARISNLTSTQMAATYFLDEDAMGSDSATAVCSQQSIVAYVAARVAALVTLSALSNQDDNSDAMVKDNSYLANSDGQLVVTWTANGSTQEAFIYVGAADNPEGNATDKRAVMEGGAFSLDTGASVIVASGEYFTVKLGTGSTGTPAIRWRSFGTLTKPTDQD